MKIHDIIRRLCGSETTEALRAENEQLLRKIKFLEAKAKGLEAEVESREKREAEILERAEKIERERDKIKELVRDQGHADTVVKALNILGLTPNIPPQESVDFEKSLKELYSAMRDTSTSVSELRRDYWKIPHTQGRATLDLSGFAAQSPHIGRASYPLY